MRTIIAIFLFLLGQSVFASQVGVIRDANTPCPAGSEQLVIAMDDEDTKPNSSVSGWTGAIHKSEIGTTLVLCRVNGELFKPWRSSYLVVRLSADCPAGAYAMVDHLFDNEDDNNETKAYGDISPSQIGRFAFLHEQAYRANDTMLRFCYFLGDPATAEKPPNLGVPYGVFGRAEPGAPWLETGVVYTDDEDDEDKYIWRSDGRLALPWAASRSIGCVQDACSIIRGDGNDPNYMRNTYLYTAKAHSGHCDEGSCTQWSDCYSTYSSGFVLWSRRQRRSCCRNGNMASETRECDVINWQTGFEATVYAARARDVIDGNHLDTAGSRIEFDLHRSPIAVGDWGIEPAIDVGAGVTRATLWPGRGERSLYHGTGRTLTIGGEALVARLHNPQWSLTSSIRYETFADFPSYQSHHTTAGIRYHATESTVVLGRGLLGFGVRHLRTTVAVNVNGTVQDPTTDMLAVLAQVEIWRTRAFSVRIRAVWSDDGHEIAFRLAYRLGQRARPADD